MFFKKYDAISEDQIMIFGITAATMCFIVESRYPAETVEGHIKYVNDSVDNVLKNIGLNPNTETLNHIRMTASTLVNSSERLIAERAQRFLNGDKRVNPNEIENALTILQNSVNSYMRQK
jgi:hypothetical protein